MLRDAQHLRHTFHGTKEGTTVEWPRRVHVGRKGIVELVTSDDFSGLKEAKAMDPNFNPLPYLGVFRAVIKGPWKFIKNPDGREELYNTAEDPGEKKNLIETHQEKAVYLAERLDAWLTRAKPYKPKDPGVGASPADEALRKRLRDLGYIH